MTTVDLSDWSPVDISSDTSHPRLHHGEVALITTDNNKTKVELYCNEAKAKHWHSCTCILTSKRVLLHDTSTKSAIGLPLQKILKTSDKSGFFDSLFESPRIRLQISEDKYYMLSFPKKDLLEAFHIMLRRAIQDELEAAASSHAVVVPTAAVTTPPQGPRELNMLRYEAVVAVKLQHAYIVKKYGMLADACSRGKVVYSHF